MRYSSSKIVLSFLGAFALVGCGANNPNPTTTPACPKDKDGRSTCSGTATHHHGGGMGFFPWFIGGGGSVSPSHGVSTGGGTSTGGTKSSAIRSGGFGSSGAAHGAFGG